MLERVGASARIQVSDTGVGIEPALLPHVFNRFLQADSTSSRQHGGLGLGLAIVRHLAELHGGSARAESAGPGLGATFTVELPILAAGSGRGERAAIERAPGAEPRLLRLDGLRVLVVDDHDDARELIRTVLQQCGADVAVATGADEALISPCRVPTASTSSGACARASVLPAAPRCRRWRSRRTRAPSIAPARWPPASRPTPPSRSRPTSWPRWCTR